MIAAGRRAAGPSAKPRRGRGWGRSTAVTGYGILALAILLVLFHRQVASYSPYATDADATLAAPSASHLLGTDELGRDVLSRIVYGLPLELLVSSASVAIAAVGGVALGLVGGYFGAPVDYAVVWLADLLFSFPAVLLAIAIVAILGPGLASVTWAIGIVYLPKFLRIARGAAIQIRSLEYMDAARAMGARWTRLLWRHVLPNTSSSLILQATLSLSTTTITASALDFLGLGAQPPSPAWGAMLNSARGNLELAPWTVLAPSLAIVILCIGYNFAGDGLRDRLDPRQDFTLG